MDKKLFYFFFYLITLPFIISSTIYARTYYSQDAVDLLPLFSFIYFAIAILETSAFFVLLHINNKIQFNSYSLSSKFYNSIFTFIANYIPVWFILNSSHDILYFRTNCPIYFISYFIIFRSYFYYRSIDWFKQKSLKLFISTTLLVNFICYILLEIAVYISYFFLLF